MTPKSLMFKVDMRGLELILYTNLMTEREWLKEIELHLFTLILRWLLLHHTEKLFKHNWRSSQSEALFIGLNRFRSSANNKNLNVGKHWAMSWI